MRTGSLASSRSFRSGDADVWYKRALIGVEAVTDPGFSPGGVPTAKIAIITARKRSLGQGNIFTPVCHSVHRGWGLPQCMLGYHPLTLGPGTPWDQAPPGPGPPGDPPGSRHPLLPQEQSRHWEIRSMSRRYASYWNAILFSNFCLKLHENERIWNPGGIPWHPP